LQKSREKDEMNDGFGGIALQAELSPSPVVLTSVPMPLELAQSVPQRFKFPLVGVRLPFE
jgi:hypothetical protein